MTARTGKCEKGAACECVDNSMLRIVCQSWQLPEELPGALEMQSILNWLRIPEAKRVAMIARLRDQVPQDMQDHWSDQVSRRVRIGSEDLHFHFGVGMAVRNELRQVMTDGDLPPVQYAAGEMRNWDDFYYGALHELAGGGELFMGWDLAKPDTDLTAYPPCQHCDQPDGPGADPCVAADHGFPERCLRQDQPLAGDGLGTHPVRFSMRGVLYIGVMLAGVWAAISGVNAAWVWLGVKFSWLMTLTTFGLIGAIAALIHSYLQSEDVEP